MLDQLLSAYQLTVKYSWINIQFKQCWTKPPRTMLHMTVADMPCCWHCYTHRHKGIYIQDFINDTACDQYRMLFVSQCSKKLARSSCQPVTSQFMSIGTLYWGNTLPHTLPHMKTGPYWLSPKTMKLDPTTDKAEAV